MNDTYTNILITLIPALTTLITIPINYYFQILKNKHMSEHSKEIYTSMLNTIYLPLYTFMHNNNCNNNDIFLKLIKMIDAHIENTPLLVDSDITNAIRLYHQTGNIKSLNTVLSHIQIEYEFLKYKLDYPSNYIFNRIVHTCYVIYSSISLLFILFFIDTKNYTTIFYIFGGFFIFMIIIKVIMKFK